MESNKSNNSTKEKMDISTYQWLKEWQSTIIASESIQENDYWITNKFGTFKNPRVISSCDVAGDAVSPNEITITIEYDEWDKSHTIEK